MVDDCAVRGKASAASQSPVFGLCALLYLTFNMSAAVLAQFLTLYYKSMGFNGTVLGILSCLTPVTTFVMAPLWGILVGQTAGTSQFHILYLTMILSVTIRTSLAVLETPRQFLIVAAWYGVFHAPIRPMMDALVMDHLSDRGVFGKVRLFGILGTGLGTSVGGYLLSLKSDVGKVGASWDKVGEYLRLHSVDLSSIWHGLSEFDLLFLAQIILTIPSLLCMRRLQLLNLTRPCNLEGTLKGSTEKPTGRMQDVARCVVREPAHILLFAIVYIVGIAGGVGDAFTYLRFLEVGFTPSHMGTSRLLSSFAGAIMFWFSGAISARLGLYNVLIVTLLSVGCRFSLLMTMNHPYYAYLAEMIRGGIYGVFWSAASLYASEQIGPPSLRAGLLLLLNGTYEGMGRSTGAILGGKIQAIVGTEKLFQYVALCNVGLALVMLLYKTLSGRPKRHSVVTIPTSNGEGTTSVTEASKKVR